MPFIGRGIDNLDENNRIVFWGKWLDELKSGKMSYAEDDFTTWMGKYVFTRHRLNYKEIIWSPHALMYVHKNLIQSNPKEYYEKLLSIVDHDINPMEGHYFERSWFHIFTRNFHLKIIFYIIIDSSIDSEKENAIRTIRDNCHYPNIEFILCNRSYGEKMDSLIDNILNGFFNQDKVKYFNCIVAPGILPGNNEYSFTGRGDDIVTWVNSRSNCVGVNPYAINCEFLANRKVLVEVKSGEGNTQYFIKREYCSTVSLNKEIGISTEKNNLAKIAKQNGLLIKQLST